MAGHSIGISVSPEIVAEADALAAADGLSRSALFAKLVSEEAARRKSRKRDAPVVLVDGVRFVPARAATRVSSVPA